MVMFGGFNTSSLFNVGVVVFTASSLVVAARAEPIEAAALSNDRQGC